MNKVISSAYQDKAQAINKIIESFHTNGIYLLEAKRNELKIFDLEGEKVAVKSFKKPNLLNQIIYRFFRPSKAQRSYEYAQKLLALGIHTPEPIAYFEKKGLLFFKESYYVSKLVEYDLTYRELIRNSPYAGNVEMLTAFTEFTYSLHEKGVHFLDHSPGNTLIKIKDDGYEFYLVDLNRMKFGQLDFDTRMDNFKRLSVIDDQIRISANAYAALCGASPETVYNAMKEAVQNFQRSFQSKKRLKKRLKFWKR